MHPRTFPVGPNPSVIIAADLNGDERPEIVTGDIGSLTDPHREHPANDELSFLVAEGDLRYVAQPPLRASFAPYAIAVANLDALKWPDLVVGSFHAVNDRHVSLFRNLGENLFEAVHFRIPVEGLIYTKQIDADEQPIFTQPGITSLAVADLDRDGLRDVVATGWSSDVLVVLMGAQAGYFGEAKFVRATGGPRDIQAADLDRDGTPELVTSMYSSGEIAIWKLGEMGELERAVDFPSRGRLPHKLRVSDLNCDGHPDLVVSHCHHDDSIVVFYGEGTFEFSVAQEIALGKDRDAIEHDIRDILVEDLNADRRPDILAACYASGQVIALLNISRDASLPQKFAPEVYPYREGKPRALCASDFNGDAVRDVGVALWDVNAVALLLGRPPQKR
jgi:hypothetical protein